MSIAIKKHDHVVFFYWVKFPIMLKPRWDINIKFELLMFVEQFFFTYTVGYGLYGLK